MSTRGSAPKLDRLGPSENRRLTLCRTLALASSYVCEAAKSEDF